jgi:hypothetical protein
MGYGTDPISYGSFLHAGKETARTVEQHKEETMSEKFL